VSSFIFWDPKSIPEARNDLSMEIIKKELASRSFETQS